jgi:hypothetical protein
MVGLFIVVIFALGFGYYVFSNVLDERKQELVDLQLQTAALEQQVEALRQMSSWRPGKCPDCGSGIYSSQAPFPTCLTP